MRRDLLGNVRVTDMARGPPGATVAPASNSRTGSTATADRLVGVTFQVAHAPTPSAPWETAVDVGCAPPQCSITAVVVPMDLLSSSIHERKVPPGAPRGRAQRVDLATS